MALFQRFPGFLTQPVCRVLCPSSAAYGLKVDGRRIALLACCTGGASMIANSTDCPINPM